MPVQGLNQGSGPNFGNPWDGKDGEDQKTDGSLSKMKAAGFEKAIYLFVYWKL